MADALCGPSSALQQFQKHSSADRTLQQDRVAARLSRTEDFRSVSVVNAGILDPEFEAFQAGAPPGPSSWLESSNAVRPTTSVSPMLRDQDLTAWADDFQQLQLTGGPTTTIQQQVGPQTSTGLDHPQGWQQEFLLQQEKAQLQQNAEMISGDLYGGQLGLQQPGAYSGMEFVPPEFPLQQPIQGVPDDASFERAFEMARLEMQKEAMGAQSETESTAISSGNLGNHPAERQTTSPFGQDSVRIGADTIPDTRENQPRGEHDAENERDALARTAGRLLETVKYDNSQKFLNSSFLELMRRLRDREVVVQGDDIVETKTIDDNYDVRTSEPSTDHSINLREPGATPSGVDSFEELDHRS